LSKLYLAALRTHVETDSLQTLEAAHEMGLQAVTAQLETLDIAKMRDKALAALGRTEGSPRRLGQLAGRAAAFFTEAVQPVKESHQLLPEDDAKLAKLNALLMRRTLDLANANRELIDIVAQRKSAAVALATKAIGSGKLIAESRSLEIHLQEITRKILSNIEDERKEMSVQLRDEIAQALLGIHVRLLALKNEVYASHTDFDTEIAILQELVKKSVETIHRFVGQIGKSKNEF